MTPAGPGRIAVSVVGGFLGSGKTTLLRRTLTGDPHTAVIVNEFGVVSLDHRLLRRCEERVAVVGGGCACCTRREDLARVLRELLDDRDQGRAELRRVVIEASGLADPAPIEFTITTDPMLRHHFAVERLTVTVDAPSGVAQLAAHPEATKQVLVADELVITKVDLVGLEHRDDLARRLVALNPVATIRTARNGIVDERLWRETVHEPGEPAVGAIGARAPNPTWRPAISQPAHLHPSHTDDVGILHVDAARPVDWLGFAVWLSMLLQAWGEQILRVKAILELDDGTLVSINGVQHVMHEPEHMPCEQALDEPPSVIFITRGLDTARVRASLLAFQRASQATRGVQGR